MRDVLLNTVGLGGFALLVVGIWWYDPGLSLVVGGGLMLAAAVYGVVVTTRKGD